MAVTSKQYADMPQFPYQEVRGQLRTGDIVLFASNDPFSRLIQAATGEWSHAAFIWVMNDIDRVLLMESVETFGVRVVALSARLDATIGGEKAPYNGKVLVVRHQQFPRPDPQDAAAMAQFNKDFGLMTRAAIDRLGSPYAPLEIVRIGLRIAAGDLKIPVPGELEPKDAYICSEYVAMCYAAMGINLQGDDKGFIAPSDIAADPNVSAVVSICHDPAADIVPAQN
jgi:hypothetical protein